MYKIEFRAVGDTKVVTLAKVPLDTLNEAVTFAIAKVRKHLGINKAVLSYYAPPVYRVSYGRDTFGFVSIRKV